jgi:hypothetical protein
MVNKKTGSNYIAGDAIQEVLPVTSEFWFQFPHLVHLNLVLLVPLLSSSVAGYDGTPSVLPNTLCSILRLETRLPDERPPDPPPVE